MAQKPMLRGELMNGEPRINYAAFRTKKRYTIIRPTIDHQVSMCH